MIGQLASWLDTFLGTYVVPTKMIVLLLLATGLFLTLRLGFLQLRRLRHGLQVTMGKFDDPNDPGDVSHFQALTTALSATVGVGNIAGVATAIHWGGPGALFWMWVTAFFGMAVKYSEVTLALKFRQVDDVGSNKSMGTVAGGPMYYIEQGLGRKWKPLAMLSGFGLLMASLMGSNAVQANTLADQVHARFAISPYITGLFSAAIVGGIMYGGIKRIGRVTAVLAPLMACIYVIAALIILGMNFAEIGPGFALIFREAFQPSAGVAGTGAGAFLLTLEWGVKRGLFSNEAGQGSAPIAHAAAQTKEPVSEGVVALLEPLIDTLVICTITGLVIITTGVWNSRFPTEFPLDSGDISYRRYDENGANKVSAPPDVIEVSGGIPSYSSDMAHLSWHEVPVERFYLDAELSQPFSGRIDILKQVATESSGGIHTVLYGKAVETGAPLTAKAFSARLGDWGELIVVFCVVLFALSTAISWSYYGDRCSLYLMGKKSLPFFKVIFLVFHYVGATAPLGMIWNLGDRFMSLATLPNLIALLFLSGLVARETNSYFSRKPWEKSD